MFPSTIELTGLGPKLEGLRWESERLLRIGRQGNLDIVLRDSSVENLHAEVRFQGQRWMLRDLAANPLFPTLVNGEAVPTRERELKSGDVLQFGKLHLVVSHLGPRIPDPTTPLPETTRPQSKKEKLAAIMAAVGSDEESAPSPDPAAAAASSPARPRIPPATPAPLATPRGNRAADRMTTSCADIDIEATASQSWHDALAMVALDERPRQGQAMLTLMRTNQHLSNLSNLDDLLQHVLNDAIAALGAQRGAILLTEPPAADLTVKAVASPSLPPSNRSHSRTLAFRSFRVGESLLCRDARIDQMLSGAQSVQRSAMSSIICALLRTPRKRIGVLHLDRGPLQAPFDESDLYLADAIAASVAVGIECAQLVELQRDQFVQAVTTLARAVEMRDQYTGDHTKRVTEYSLLLADELKLSAAERYQIQIGAPLHDIGKIGVDDAVLRKPGKLTEGEYLHIQQHTVKGAEMLQQMFSLAPVIPIVRHHHERWDGTGYPDRLARDRVALTARIVAVADAFDAMTSHRPYRPAMPPQLAFLEILSKAGAHFDPTCVQAFLKIRAKIEQTMKANGH